MKLDLAVRNVVGRFNSRSAGIVIVKFPRSQSAVVRYAASNFDQACGTEVRPSELFLARPNYLHRLVGKLCKARRLNGYFTGVFSAVTGARIGHDHAHALLRNSECFGQFAADAKRPLRAGPNG